MIWKHLDHYDADGFPRDNSKFKENWSHIIDSSSPGSGKCSKNHFSHIVFHLERPSYSSYNSWLQKDFSACFISTAGPVKDDVSP